MTFEKAFESIKKKFENADATGVADFALQITMSDEDCGGTFYAAVRDGVLAVEPYDYQDNNAVLDITKSDFLKLIGGKMSIEKAVDNGASLKGDLTVIDSLRATIKAPAKKAAPKKTVVKKAEPKKEATPKKETVKKETAPKKETAKKEATPKKETVKKAETKVEAPKAEAKKTIEKKTVKKTTK